MRSVFQFGDRVIGSGGIRGMEIEEKEDNQEIESRRTGSGGIRGLEIEGKDGNKRLEIEEKEWMKEL